VNKAEALRRLAEAAAPYGLRVVRTENSLLSELILIRPSDGPPVARLQYFEPDAGRRRLRSLIREYVSEAAQAEIEQHMQERLAPVVHEVFSFTLCMSLADRPAGAGAS